MENSLIGIVQYMDGGYEQIAIDERFDATLYTKYDTNTFLFMKQEIYDSLDTSVKDTMGIATQSDAMTADEMLARNIMYVLEDEDAGFDRNEFIEIVEIVTGKELKYIVVVDVLY